MGRLLGMLAALALLAGACANAASDNASAPAKAAAGVGPPAGTRDPSKLTLEAVSTRPEYVTGDDVTVAIYPPTGSNVDPTSTTITANGAVAKPKWTTDKAGRTVANVAGLKPGKNELVATLGGDTAILTVADHPTTGPLFSGPALPMPVCSTEAYGLGPATDANCSAPTKITWRYKSTDGSTKPLDDPKAQPADLATVKDGPNQGKPFIIREEAGVLNRSIYWIDVLDPQPAAAEFDASGWNGRLVYQFGGGCGTTYTQGFLMLSRAPDDLIAKGYATATGTLNTFQVMCNDVLSAETALVVKEHFSETYGPPVFTIGSGGSGGAIQQYLIAYNYPGILDAVGATLPFPDALSISPGVVDCVLLNSYYGTDNGKTLTNDQRAAINGQLSTKTCDFWASTFAQNIRPDTGCSLDILANAGDFVKGLPTGSGQGSGVPRLPDDQRYDPASNKSGLRCTLQDGMVNVLGKDPTTGFARRPLDNTGVQYGLAALNAGTITPDQFLDLNEKIGGADIDGRPTAERMKTSEDNIRPVYETGRVVEGGGPLDTIPIITVNVYTDDQGDIHDRFRAFSLRDRLKRPDGTSAPNHMIWTRGVPKGQSMIDALTGTVDVGTELVSTLDEWLTNMSQNAPSAGVTETLERSRPAAAIDNCIDPSGSRVSGLDVYDKPGPCRDLYPIHGDPRTAAGAPRRNDIGKCQLQPVATAFDVKIVAAPFTDAQKARYESVFGDGVCDWSKPGVGQVPTKGPWQDYGR
ncbi:MAG: hypothetical protein HYX32_13410 [Actinobacteria bacterium]|nr:hypothetical protein [Actinomycetota bacterium]